MNESIKLWLAKRMVRYRIPLALLCLLFTAIVVPTSQRMKYDRSVRSFFDVDNLHLITYQRAQEHFGGDTLCLAVYTDPDLLTVNGLVRLDQFTQKLRAVPGVLKATSLAEMRSPLDPVSIGDVSAMLSPQRERGDGDLPLLARRLEAAGPEADKVRDAVRRCEMYADQFIGSDGQTTAVVLLADPIWMGSGKFTDSLVTLRNIAAENPHPAQIVGAPIMINDVYDFLDQDAWVLANVSSIATMLVILVLFRRIRWMILPFVVVQISLIWMRALMAVWEIQLSITSSLTTSLITVIGIATSIHIAFRFRDECARDGNLLAALERMLAGLIGPIFWTCATTALGFASLATSNVMPVRDFGIVMGIASMAVGAAAFLLMPAGILIGGRGVIPQRLPAEPRLVLLLDRTMHWVTIHSLRTAVLVLGVAAIALYGMRWTTVETDFTKNFREDSQVLEGYRFVEARMGGAGFVELAFDVPKDPASVDIERIRICAERLRAIPGVTKVTGLSDFLDFFSPQTGASLANGPKGTGGFLQTMQLRALKSLKVPEVQQFWNTDANQMRLVLRVREQQSTTEKALLLTQIETIAKQSLGGSAHITGLYYLLVNLIDGLLRDQWLSIGVSAAGLLAMMTYAFRSLRLGIVAFLPNLIPMSIVLGSMGWLGLKLNVATAMIQSISMGLAIDFSIHYLTRFTDELKSGADFYTALSRTHQGTGRAMVSASLALICGFGVLTFSNFLPTIHFGLLVSIAMIGGLVGSLVALPVLLRLFYLVKDPPPSHLLQSITSRVQEELAKGHSDPAVQQP